MNDIVQSKIIAQSEQQTPHECCGFVILNNITKLVDIFPCENIAEDKTHHFVIAPNKLIEAEKIGKIIAYYHSHTMGDENPSLADKVNSRALSLPSIIYSIISRKFAFYIPENFETPLVGRPFVWGVLDCWCLVCDYYKQNLKIDLNNNFFRTSQEDLLQNDYFEKNIEAQNLVVVHDLKEHDILLMKINSKIANHTAVYLGHEQILHHPGDRLSQRTFYGSFWKKNTYLKCRHRNLL